MFFSISIATCYALCNFTRNCERFLGFRRAHYNLPAGCFGPRPPFKDPKRSKPFPRELPLEDPILLLCSSEQRLFFREDLYKNFLDLTLLDQQQLFPDLLLARLEVCLRRGLDSSTRINDAERFCRWNHKNDSHTASIFEGDFGIILLPSVPQNQSPSLQSQFQQEDNTSSWSDVNGYHTQQNITTSFQGFTLTFDAYTFCSPSGSNQIEQTTETLTDPTGARYATKTVYKWTDGRSSFFKQNNIMHSTTADKQITSITEEVKQSDYSVFGMTSDWTESRTQHIVVAGKVTTTDETFSTTESNGNGITVVSKSKNCTQRTIKDDKTTKISYEEVESVTNGLTTSGRESNCQSFQSEDLYQSETFTRSTNRDGSSTWEATEVTVRLKDNCYFVKSVRPTQSGDDVIGEDELHRYFQC